VLDYVYKYQVKTVIVSTDHSVETHLLVLLVNQDTTYHQVIVSKYNQTIFNAHKEQFQEVASHALVVTINTI